MLISVAVQSDTKWAGGIGCQSAKCSDPDLRDPQRLPDGLKEIITTYKEAM